jgi:hypothetical protein
MARALILNDIIIRELQELKQYAEQHPLTMDDLLDIKNGDHPSPGDIKEFVRLIPIGYRVVLTIEHQLEKHIRHLSMSVNTKGKMPNEYAVKRVMGILGFKNKIYECILNVEEFDVGHYAINVLEIIKNGIHKSSATFKH